MAIQILRGAKKLVLPGGRAWRRVMAGPLRGSELWLDLHHHSSVVAGLYERELNPWLSAARYRTALDIGCSEGWHTVQFLRSGADVLAVDMNEDALDIAIGNVDHNRLKRPRLERAAVGIDLSVSDLLDRSRLPVLVKMDIEGAELKALQSAGSWLENNQIRWIVEVHSSDMDQRCRDLLRSRGRDVLTLKPAWWRVVLPEFRPLPVNHWLIA